MTTLADRWDEGTWMLEGWHQTKVVKSEVSKPTDNEKVSFGLADTTTGATGKADFWLTEKAMGFLIEFAQACGLTREEARSYDPYKPRCHDVLVGRTLNVLITSRDGTGKDGTQRTFREATSWSPLSEDPNAPASPRVARPETSAEPPPPNQTAQRGGAVAPDVDVPF